MRSAPGQRKHVYSRGHFKYRFPIKYLITLPLKHTCAPCISLHRACTGNMQIVGPCLNRPSETGRQHSCCSQRHHTGWVEWVTETPLRRFQDVKWLWKRGAETGRYSLANGKEQRRPTFLQSGVLRKGSSGTAPALRVVFFDKQQAIHALSTLE